MKEEAVSHGVITSLSPLKKDQSTGSQYFDGELCDGTQTLRFLSPTSPLYTPAIEKCKLYSHE